MPDEHNSPLAQLSQTRKNALLLIFSVAQFIDVCNVSGVTVAVAQISVDIALGPSQVVWVRSLSSTTGTETDDRTSDNYRLCVLSACVRPDSIADAFRSPADSLTFAAFLLFAGRLSDLFPAQLIFEGGFFLLGVFSLVTSFVTSSKYGFLILRGIGGVCGAMSEWISLASLRMD